MSIKFIHDILTAVDFIRVSINCDNDAAGTDCSALVGLLYS